MIEPMRPSVWRRASRNTARNVSAVRIASGEYQACPPRVVRGAAFQAAIASSLNQTVRLPRWRKLASYAAQFVPLRFCFGMWWRRAALALNGMAVISDQNGERLLSQSILPRQSSIRATTPVRPQGRPSRISLIHGVLRTTTLSLLLPPVRGREVAMNTIQEKGLNSGEPERPAMPPFPTTTGELINTLAHFHRG